MRWFRIRLVILGLLLFVVHVGSVAGETCDTGYSDPSSNAILADIVIEGRVKSRPTGNGDRYNSSIQVRKILKGKTLVNGGKRTKKVTVGVFGTLNKTQCVSEITYNKKYIFFLRVSVGNGKYFQQSALPVEAKKKTARSIKKIVCKNCAKAPVIKKMGNQRKKVGQKVKIRCSVKAKPNASFLWFKDGLQITSRKGLRIKSGRRGSRLEIKKAKTGDNGVYMCQAKNAVGESNASMNLEIEVAKPKYPECSSQTYCLNGGNCRYISDLKRQFCVCPRTFTGARCEQLASTEVIGGVEQAKLLHDRTLIIIGIVIAILIFIAICIISYYLAKRQRKKFEARRLSRNIPRQTRGHYQTLDEVDSGHHRLATRCYKDKRIQTDNLAELSPSTQVSPDNGTAGQPRVFSMEESFPPMSNQKSGRQQQSDPKMRRSSSRGSRTRLKAVSLDEGGADEPDSIPMTEMPRSLRSEGSIHDVVKRNKRNRYGRDPASLPESQVRDLHNIESDDPVVAGMDASDSFSESLDGLSDQERHLFTDNTTAEPDRNMSDTDDARDVELPLLNNKKKGSLDLDTDSEDQMEEETTFTPLHISEENLHRSSGSSLDTGYDRSREPEYPEDYRYPEDAETPEAPTPESSLVRNVPDKNVFNAGRTADVLPNGPRHPVVVVDMVDSDSNDNPDSSDRSGTSLTGSRDSVDNSTSGASSQVPNDADDKLSWDENGTPVSSNYAFTAAMNDDPLTYMHQEVPVSPSKQKEVCNRLLKDLCEDQGPIQI
ncbi:uncharacterized protein LOC121379914 isoform X2 [Gigantopelta aegis]|uniref:uncharacterized protein LOC121379914 isoform X2 n=1 Tax=Gigantopelta aegis TaxID=1735272 RepID=UPI001B88C7E3|nr:uncharacterized protein LOC121379914 isoform X2 [Gigantopelta aegis]